MIILCGIPSETPLAMVGSELDAMGAPYAVFNQRRFAEYAMEFDIGDGTIDGVLDLGSERYPLEEITGVLVRLMDDRLLPELEGQPEGSAARMACRQLHDTLVQWFEIAPGRVLNRYGAMASNGSKPFQAQVVMSHGFRTPETLVTNDPAEVVRFRRVHDRIVYKSLSGYRSIVTEFTDDDLARLDHIRSCPTQFQAFVDGRDVRVHVVGDEVFGTGVLASGVDYRYSHSTSGDAAQLEEIDLPSHVAQRAVALAADLGLPLAGIDLMVTGDGDVYCLEVNPSPAFSYYEQHTGQPIARSIARYLAAA